MLALEGFDLFNRYLPRAQLVKNDLHILVIACCRRSANQHFLQLEVVVREFFLHFVAGLILNLITFMDQLDQCAQRLDVLALQFGRPARWLVPQQSVLQSLQRRTDMAALRTMGARHSTLSGLLHRQQVASRAALGHLSNGLDALAMRVRAVDPHVVLSRGYTWLSDGSGRPVTSGAGLQGGEHLKAQWADACANVQVLDVQPNLPLD